MVDIKETVKSMCDAMPGGRSAMAGALGMSITTFNNKLYEKNGCRFFELHEIEAMEDLSGTDLFAEYAANRRNYMLLKKHSKEELDRVELFHIGALEAARRGRVDLTIQESILNDGVIDKNEAMTILELHGQHVSTREEYVRSVLELHKES